jgi:hypothetical protein
VADHKLGKDAVMTQVLDDMELTVSLPAEPSLLLSRGRRPGQLKTDAAFGAHPGPRGDEVLPAEAFVEQVTERPIPDPSAPIGRLEAGLVEGVADFLR